MFPLYSPIKEWQRVALGNKEKEIEKKKPTSDKKLLIMKERKNLCASIVGWGVFLAGAFAFSSCVNDEEIDNGLQTTGQSIGFSASYGNSIWEPDQIRAAHDASGSTYSEYVCSFNSQQGESRGALIDSKNANWSYKVGAYYTTDPTATGTAAKTINYFDENTTAGGLTIVSNNDNATTSYYWPPVGNMKFFAVAPADVVGTPTDDGTNFAIPTVSDIISPVLTYTIPETVASQKDIMVAQSSVACSINNPTVGLQFQHLLSAVQFKVGEMNDVQINAITVSGVKGGTVTMTYDSTNGWAYSSTTNASYSPTPNTLSTFTRGTEITSGDNIMLVMPQTLGENAQVSVTYTASGVQDTKSVALNSTTSSNDDAWIAGRIHNYYLNINPGLPLSLTVEVQPWELITVTNEFSQTVTVDAGDKIRWLSGTFNSDATQPSTYVDGEENDIFTTENEVVLLDDINTPAKFTFTIAGPMGGTWKAFFVAESGSNPNAFTITPSEGAVGTECTVEIKATGNNTSNAAYRSELCFAVLTGQNILPVDNLTTSLDDNGFACNYTIVQNIKIQ